MNELPGKAVSYYGGTAQRGHSTRASLRDYKAQRRRSMDELNARDKESPGQRKAELGGFGKPVFENE